MADSGGSLKVAPSSGCADAGSGALQVPYLFPSSLFVDASPRQNAVGEWRSRWWLVYTKSRQEKALSGDLSALKIPHYLPVHARAAVTRGRSRIVEEPLFSGYLFIFADADQRTAALTTNRVSMTCPVDDEDRLRRELWQLARSIAAGVRLTLEANLEAGDWVRVKSGIHEGLEGAVIRRMGQTRLLLAVNFLKRGASLEVHESLLEKIDPPLENARSSVEISRRCGR